MVQWSNPPSDPCIRPLRKPKKYHVYYARLKLLRVPPRLPDYNSAADVEPTQSATPATFGKIAVLQMSCAQAYPIPPRDSSNPGCLLTPAAFLGGVGGTW